MQELLFCLYKTESLFSLTMQLPTMMKYRKWSCDFSYQSRAEPSLCMRRYTDVHSTEINVIFFKILIKFMCSL